MTAVRRISHGMYATVLGVVSLGLVTNLLLAVACLPLIVLAIGTDPALSWPYLAGAVVLAGPGISAAFTVFHEHGVGGAAPLRAFLRGLRATWRKALAVSAMTVAALVVLLVDVRALSASAAGVVIVPVLLVLSVLAAAVGLVALVAVAEAPGARLRDIVRAAAYLAVRRWYLTAVSLGILGVLLVLFVNLPALALGIAASPALFLVWSNSRYTLRPVLETDDVASA
jgi:uncharacterized membrane protein YesL